MSKECCRLLDPQTLGEIRTDVWDFVPSGKNREDTEVTLVCEHAANDLLIRDRADVNEALMCVIVETHPQVGISRFMNLFEEAGLIPSSHESEN